MPININNLILKISSRISDRVDGDTVLLIEQNLPTSIYRVTKALAQAKPKGHELLLKEQTLSSIVSASLPEYSGYKKFDISSLTDRIVTDEAFHSLYVDSYRAFPMKSMAALGLSTVHNKVCYYVEYPYIYFNFPTGVNGTTGKLTHYTYLPPTEFPSELEDYLVDDLVQLLAGEAQKQATEMTVPSI